MRFFIDYSISVIKSDKIKVLLAVFGIIIGLSVYGAIKLANQSILLNFKNNKSFFGKENSLNIYKLNGKINLEEFKTIIETKNLKSLQIQNEKDVQIIKGSNKENAQLIGIDILSGLKKLDNKKSDIKNLIPLLKKEAVLTNFKNNNNLKLLIDNKNFLIKKTYSLPAEFNSISANKNIIIADISYFEFLTNSYNLFDKVILNLAKKDLEKTKKILRKKLANNILIETPTEQLNRFSHLTKAFRLNLNFLAAISLLVAVLLIFNTTSFLCLKRTKDFATLMSIGLTPKKIFYFILSENLIISILATIFGIIGAILLASFLVKIQASTISSLYNPETKGALLISKTIILELLFLGPILSLAGTIIPALDSFNLEIKKAFYKTNTEILFKKRSKIFLSIAIISAILAYLSTNPKFLEISLIFGFLPPTLLCISAISFSPIYLYYLCKLILKLSRSINITLATDHLLSNLKRHSIVVSAIAIAFGMFLGVSIMILSFRSTVSNWLMFIIKADVYISLPSKGANFNTSSIPKKYLVKIKENNKIKAINYTATMFIPYKDSRTQLSAQNFSVLKDYNSLLLKENYSEAKRKELLKKDSIFISESFSKKYNLKRGDSLNIPLKNGDLSGKITEIFTDYSQEHGVILIDREKFVKLTDSQHVNGLGVYFKENINTKSFINDFNNTELKVRDSVSLRKEVFEIFDKTFQLTYVLKIISLLLATLVLANSLLILLLERKREFMTFRAIGASNKSLTKMIISESILLSSFGSILGFILSIPLSLILVFVINKHFFGWSVIYEFPALSVLNAIFSLLFIAILIGLIVAKLELKNIKSSLLKYE